MAGVFLGWKGLSADPSAPGTILHLLRKRPQLENENGDASSKRTSENAANSSRLAYPSKQFPEASTSKCSHIAA